MTQRAGWEARVTIDGVAYAVKRWSIKPAVTSIDVTNSEGRPGDSTQADAPGYGGVISGVGRAKVMLQSATFDDDDNPFAAPLSLQEGGYHDVVIYPAGLAGDSHEVHVMIEDLTHEGDVDGPQPVTIEASSDGAYTLAGQL